MKLINYRGAYITPLKINEPDWALLPSVNVNALEYKDKELFWGQKTVTGSQGDYDYYFKIGFNKYGDPYVRLASEEAAYDIFKKANITENRRGLVLDHKYLWNIGGKDKYLYEILWKYFYKSNIPSASAAADRLTKNWSLKEILDDAIEMMHVITKLQDEELGFKTTGGAKVITLDALLKSLKKEGN